MVKSEGLLLSYFQSEIVFSSHQACLQYSSFHNLHSRFQPNIPSTLKESRRTSTVIDQAQFAGVFQSGVKSLSFAGDSNSLAVSCGSEVILCDSSSWLPSHDTEKRTPISRLKVDFDHRLEQVVYSSDSTWLAITTQKKDSASVCDLVLYSCSGTGDNIEAWKLQHRRSPTSKGENVFGPVTTISGQYLTWSVTKRAIRSVDLFLADFPASNCCREHDSPHLYVGYYSNVERIFH